MKKLLALPLLVLAVFVGTSSVAESKVPGFGTEDSCAAGFFTEDANACGGSVWFTYDGGYTYNGYTYCFYVQHPNGQHITQTYTGVYDCPSQPRF